MYLQDKIDDKIIVAHFCQEIYVVKNLKTKLLLEINIIDLERIIVDANRRKLIIKSCRSLKTKLKTKSKNDIRMKRVVKVEKSLVIIVHSIFEILIIVRDKILLNRDYLFESILFDAYSYVANREMPFVCVRNDRLVPLRISQYATLRRLLEFKKQNYY